QGAVTAAQSKTRRRTPQGDAELMAEEQVLGFKPARGLEEVNDEHCERIKEREHRSRSCDDSTRRCDSQAGWDFRKGQVANAPLPAQWNLVSPHSLSGIAWWRRVLVGSYLCKANAALAQVVDGCSAVVT